MNLLNFPQLRGSVRSNSIDSDFLRDHPVIPETEKEIIHHVRIDKRVPRLRGWNDREKAPECDGGMLRKRGEKLVMMTAVSGVFSMP